MAMAATATFGVIGVMWGLAAHEAIGEDATPPPSQGAQNVASTKGDAFDIGADELAVDGTSREARFVGHVVARRGEWVLRCPSLVARYDDTGALIGATLTGPVEVTGPDFWAKAGAATMDRTADTIVLTGKPSLRRGQSVLRATQVTVHLESDKIEMTDVRGRFVMDDLSGVAPPKGESDTSGASAPKSDRKATQQSTPASENDSKAIQNSPASEAAE